MVKISFFSLSLPLYIEEVCNEKKKSGVFLKDRCLKVSRTQPKFLGSFQEGQLLTKAGDFS